MADLATLEQLDGFAGLRGALRDIARKTGAWAGIPMPIEGQRLVIEPNFPNAEGLMNVTAKPRPEDDGNLLVDRVRIIAALCLHPIAYYEGSWAGAMCPTDDVIAHLMLMRGDEAMFWRRANQHSPARPEAGL